MGELRRRVPAEEADARGSDIHRGHQGLCPHRFFSPALHPVVPVLAVEAVERAGLVEHGQVLVAVLRAGPVREPGMAMARTARADEVGHAVRGERIVVPAHYGLGPIPGGQPAVTHPAQRDATAVGANPAGGPLLGPRRLLRQLKQPARPGVGLGDERRCFRVPRSEAVPAYPKGLGHQGVPPGA